MPIPPAPEFETSSNNPPPEPHPGAWVPVPPPPNRYLTCLILLIGAMLLSAVVVWILIGALHNDEIHAARVHLGTVKAAISSYQSHNGVLPGQLNDLVVPPASTRLKRLYITEGGLKDPWGERVHYLNPGKRDPTSYDLYSSGPDKKAGTDDDVYP